MNIKNIITALVLTLSISVSAAVEPIITGSDSKTFTVDLADWARYDVKVQISDVAGTIMITDEIVNAAGRKYNLRALDNGTYEVAVSNQLRTITSTIIVSGSTVSVLGSNTMYKPVVKISKDYFDVNALTQGRAVRVALYNSLNELFSVVYDNVPTVTKRFMTKDLPAGTYTLVVSKGANSITKTIRK